MRTYELLGRIVFGAEDTVDAYKKLANHFADLAVGRASTVELEGSHIKVRPVSMSHGGFPAAEAPTTRDAQRCARCGQLGAGCLCDGSFPGAKK